MNFTQQLLVELFKKASNFKAVKIGKVSQGSSVNVNLGYGTVSAQALQDLSGSDAIVFQTDQGNWYLIGATTVNQNNSNTKQIIYRKTEQKNTVKYPIILLLGVEAESYDAPLPNTENHTEFYLTGGNYRKKKVDNLSDGYNRYDSRYSSNTGFITNLGNGRYYAATNLYIPIESTLYSAGYGESRLLKFIKNNTLTIVNIDKTQINQDLYYQGNGIWQGVPENGMTDMLNALAEEIYSSQVNVLPRDKNVVVYDGELHQMVGTVYFETLTSDNLLLRFVKGFSNKSIEYETYLPLGNSTFSYNALRSGSLPEFNYTETMSGELFTIAWDKQYITHTFNLQQLTNLTQKYPAATEGTEDYYKCSISSAVTSKTQQIKLKTFGDTEETKTILLDTNSKFLVIPMTPEMPITEETTAFNVKYTDITGVYYEDIIDTEDDPFNFIGEIIITSYAIDDKRPYLIRGVIQSITLTPVTVSGNTVNKIKYVVSITSKKSLPKARYSTQNNFYKNNDGVWGLPINNIILDNGNFWNYWIAAQNNAFFSKTNKLEVQYKDFTYFENDWFGVMSNPPFASPYKLSPMRGFIHTNPISAYLARGFFYPAHPILLTDNLVSNKIYSVRNSYHLQDYNYLITGDTLDEQIRYSEIPVAQWNITPDGKIKYNNTFLVAYEMTIPYFAGDPKILVSGLTVPQSYSYYPE